YRRALRHVVFRAQAANDGALLSDPYSQIKAMLDMQLVDLEHDAHEL
ncbi:hypothetical protein H632_c1854p0, partial [Helicosporidium sp. ATCC 50920]